MTTTRKPHETKMEQMLRGIHADVGQIKRAVIKMYDQLRDVAASTDAVYDAVSTGPHTREQMLPEYDDEHE